MSRLGASPGRSTAGKAIVAAAALAVAGFSALVTWGGINKTRAPALALAAWPKNGFAAANAAVVSVASQVGSNPATIDTIRIPDPVRRLALEGYRREPLAGRALGVIGLAAAGKPAPNDGRAVMDAALAVSRRDGLVNGWFVADASRRGDLKDAVTALNRSITTNPDSASVYIPAMLKALEEPATIPVMRDILRARPAWEAGFWQQAPGYRAAIGNIGKLRTGLAHSPDATGETDRALLENLAAKGEFATAAALYRKLAGSADGKGSNGVRNGGFTRQPTWPVFEWSLLATGEYSGTIDPKVGLIVDALSGSGGTIARQLLSLDSGSWRVATRLANAYEADGNKLAVRLSCATNGNRLLDAELDRQAFQRSFAVPAGCGFQWLDIVAVPSVMENRELLALRSIAVTRAR